MRIAGLLLLAALAPGAAAAPPVARGNLRFSIAAPPGQSVPREVAVRVRPTLGVKGLEDRPWEVTVSSPVRNGECLCEVPAGQVDLRIQGAAAMPVYRWAELVEPGRTTDLGPLKLERGASISGWVRTADEKVVTHSVLVTLESPGVGSPVAGSSKENRSIRLEAGSRPWGFFKFDGVAPGSYVVAASEPGLPTARFGPIEIEGDRSFEIPTPLELARSLELVVRMTPAGTPYGPWELKLMPLHPGMMEVSPKDLVGQAGPDGLWRARGLVAGDYDLRIRVLDHFFKTIPVHVGTDSQIMAVNIPLVRVRGRDPAAGVVELSTGSLGAFLHPDGASQLDGYIPDEPAWDVAMAPHGPLGVFRLQEPAKVLKTGGLARLDIEIPNTRLAVEVVDEKGNPLRGADVFVLGQGHFRSLTDGDGKAEFRGLKPGPQRVLARLDPFARKSRTAEVVLREIDNPSPLRLVVPEVMDIRGHVHPRFGFAPGTRVYAWPSAAELREEISARTDQDGDFLLSLPAGTRKVNLAVLAPGSALRLLDAEVATYRLLEIGVEPAGGTLLLDLPAAEMEIKPSEDPEEEVWTMPRLLRHWADLQGTPQTPGRLVVPNVEPGPYSLCATNTSPVLRKGAPPEDDPRCVGGVLQAAGELALKLPSLPPLTASK